MEAQLRQVTMGFVAKPDRSLLMLWEHLIRHLLLRHNAYKNDDLPLLGCRIVRRIGEMTVPKIYSFENNYK